MTRDRKITYRWAVVPPTLIPGSPIPIPPIVTLYENGYIVPYTLPALEKALAAEKAATRPTGKHICGYKWERDRLDRIRKFEEGLNAIKSQTNQP